MKLTRLPLLVVAMLAITFSLAVRAQAQITTFVGEFDGTNGWEPYGSVTQGTDGNFYGTATGGVDAGGNIFRMTPSGEITNLYTFCSSNINCPDGEFPQTAPILGSDGNMYGVTYAGGSGNSGVFYRLTTGGEYTILYTFCANFPCNNDGLDPVSIILASDGNFYGITNYGGTGGEGTIFKITPTGQYTQLYSFCSLKNCTDGGPAFYPLVQGNDGNFYGTAYQGGSMGGGVIWELTASGTYKVLYNFCYNEDAEKCPDGSFPGPITKDAQGNFIGITGAGPSYIVYQMTPGGQYSVLSNFVFDGELGWPGTQLTLASDGNLYGTLNGGGSGSWAPKASGAIFKVTPEGQFVGLYNFCYCQHSTGFTPLDPVFQATDGTFYGTTAYGGIGGAPNDGDIGYGTVFQFSNGLSPLVETAPVAGPVGQSVVIVGNHLTGSASVTFNGVAAKFTVESDTYIKATVPKGATTGLVSVVTPSGTLNSNPQFVVTR